MPALVLRFAATTAIALSVLAIPASASAAPSSDASSQAQTGDVVRLHKGDVVRGRLTEIVPGSHVSLIVEGNPRRIEWSEVAQIVTEDRATINGAPAPSAEAPRAIPQTPTHLDSPPTTEPPMVWRANSTLMTTGAILYATGYVPNFALAAPSTVKVLGTGVLIVFTLGFLLMTCGDRGDGDGDPCFGNRGGVQLLVPVAGPILFASNTPRDADLNEHGRALEPYKRDLLYLSAGLQAAGLTSILLGIALGKREPVAERKRAGSPSFFLSPMGGPGTVGVSFGVHRW